MNKLIIVTVLFGVMHLSVQAQEPTLNSVLTGYYKVNDALVSSDSKAAAAAAADMLQAVTKIDMSAIPVKDHMAFMNLQNKLAFDSRHISESTDINHQREHFTSLSANMSTLAKQAHLAQEPVYQEYCPMKKSYWLTPDTAIKNPYYGAAMPDCGKVTGTLKP
jgi:Protein of unknown function (DUF3347)